MMANRRILEQQATLSVTIEQEQLDKVRKIADEEKASTSAVVRKALDIFLRWRATNQSSSGSIL